MGGSEQIYHQRSSLRKSENNVSLLLTWSSIVHGQPLRVLSEWASSVDGLKLYQQLVGDLRNSQRTEQLAMTLAALVCHQRRAEWWRWWRVRRNAPSSIHASSKASEAVQGISWILSAEIGIAKEPCWVQYCGFIKSLKRTWTKRSTRVNHNATNQVLLKNFIFR